MDGADVRCHVTVGGELRSRKGLNLPGIDLGISAFTDHDRACLEFAIAHGVDAVSQSFVETADDIEQVRAATKALGRDALRHREDRARRGARPLRRDPPGRRRHHGGPRRPGRGGPHRTDRDHPEGPDRPRQSRRQADHHRDADAGVDGVEPPADARGGDRRRECDPGRDRLRDAVGRVGRGPVPGGGRQDARQNCRRDRAPSGRPRTEPGDRVLPRSPARNDCRGRGHGRRTRARHGALRRGVRPDPIGRHRSDKLSRFKPAVSDRRRERRPRRLSGPGVFLRRLACRCRGGAGRLVGLPRAWMDAHGVTGRAILVAGPSPAHPDARYRIEFMRVGTAI